MSRMSDASALLTTAATLQEEAREAHNAQARISQLIHQQRLENTTQTEEEELRELIAQFPRGTAKRLGAEADRAIAGAQVLATMAMVESLVQIEGALKRA